MKTKNQTVERANVVINNNNESVTIAAAKVAKTPTTATYIERMHVNRDLLVCNLSKLWKDCQNGTLIPRDVLSLDKTKDFAEFRAYMCERHGLKAGEQPRKGWSVWYALQFCEKRVKAAVQDENAPTHAKAVAYLRKTRANLQDQAAKMF